MLSTYMLLVAMVIFLVFVHATFAADRAPFSYPPSVSLGDVRQWIDKASTDHPRLFARPADFKALRESLGEDPLRAKLAATPSSSRRTSCRTFPPSSISCRGGACLGNPGGASSGWCCWRWPTT